MSTRPSKADSIAIARDVKLLVVIVNYRTPDLTVACLHSLAPQVSSVQGVKVIVVDNGSGDDSVPRIRTTIHEQRWHEWVTMLPLETNIGFAAGNNRGIAYSHSMEYVLLLNSDTIVHPGCLAYCLQVMDAEPNLGVMSCKVLNPDGSIQNVARKFTTPLNAVVGALGLPWYCPHLFGWADPEDLTWDRDVTRRDVDWLAGAFMLVRGELLLRMGGLDEDFFFYGEDVEFCHRVWQSGYRCHYDPTVSITHLGGASSDPERLASAQKHWHFWRARYLVQRKCYGRTAATAVRIFDFMMWHLRLLLLRCPGQQNKHRYRYVTEVCRTLAQRLHAGVSSPRSVRHICGEENRPM